MTKSLIIIKPGFLEYAEDVLNTFTSIGYSIVKLKRTTLKKSQCNIIWNDVKKQSDEGKYPTPDYYEQYRSYIMSGEVDCVVIQKESGDYTDIIQGKRLLRKKYHVSGFQDLLHASDSNERAEKEINCIFGN